MKGIEVSWRRPVERHSATDHTTSDACVTTDSPFYLGVLLFLVIKLLLRQPDGTIQSHRQATVSPSY